MTIRHARFAELGISQSARSSALRRDVGGRLRLGACGGLDGEHVAGVAAALSTAGQRLLFHHTTIPYMYSYEESAVPLQAYTALSDRKGDAAQTQSASSRHLPLSPPLVG